MKQLNKSRTRLVRIDSRGLIMNGDVRDQLPRRSTLLAWFHDASERSLFAEVALPPAKKRPIRAYPKPRR